MRIFRPKGYTYLTKWEWFRRELDIFGCRHNLWHFNKHHGWGCWCDFWDAQ